MKTSKKLSSSPVLIAARARGVRRGRRRSSAGSISRSAAPAGGPQKRGRPEQSPRYEPCLRYIFSGPVGTPDPPERQRINTHPAAHSSLPPSGSGRRAADAGQGRTPTPPARLGARGVRSPPHTGVGVADLPRKKLGEERGPSLQTSRQGYRHL
ncbi:hypothetical protein J1605_011767 [Eschrichtius robustus]|uniref:Uncharacterized protein n=1 Tax=Eschrichtius robustus TaxID=9764 RepID=A0AB34GJQ3_ESCRO|nr:hypothetical protein J1605_012306 [Eschrichtius robustus]KAJ8780503.1 hypothetical protein J1605_011767 [Eschrichtius robustus]